MGGKSLELLSTVVHIVVVAVAFSVGMSASGADLRGTLRRPALMLTSLVAVMVTVPTIAVIIVKSFSLPPFVGAGILIAAIAIGPVAAFKKVHRVGGDENYALGLNVVLLLSSLVYVPVAVLVLGFLFDRNLHLGVADVAKVILPLQLLPLLVGAVLGKLAPRFTSRIEKPVTRVTNVLLLLVFAAAMVLFFKPLVALGWRAWVAIASFAVLADATGFILGGPGRDRRIVLAAFTGLRFPGLAILLSHLAKDGKQTIPVIVAYFLCSTLLVSALFALGRRPTGGPVIRHEGLGAAR